MLSQPGTTDAVGGTDDASGGALLPQEFAALFQRASRRLWCVAVGIVGDRATAEDIVQDAAAIALEKLAQFDRATSFNAWMAQIVRYIAMNQRRRAGRHRTAPVDPLTMAAHQDAAQSRSASWPTSPPSHATTGPRQAIDRHGRLMPGQTAFDDGVVAALKELGEMARSCLLLRTVLDLSYAEIAELLAIPEGTAMSHVHRSRHALRDRLSRHGEGTR